MSDDLKSAKEKAAEYTESTPEEGASKGQERHAVQESPRELEEWESLANQRIEDAMRAGAFDNLSGKGKPLRKDDDAFEPNDLRMANKLLKNNDMAPGWIGARNRLMQEVEMLRQEISQTAERYSDLLAASTSPTLVQEVRNGWGLHVAQWDETVQELNRKILTLNLQLPTVRLELFQLRLAEELARAGAAREIVPPAEE